MYCSVEQNETENMFYYSLLENPEDLRERGRCTDGAIK
jgi:hypothetical protein